MDATFFTAQRDEAMGVSAWDDIPDEPAGESLRMAGPGTLKALARLVSHGDEGSVGPLRDATCRSFPVWAFDRALSRRLAGLSDAEIDSLAERWLEDPGAAGMDVDLYELSTLLSGVRDALRERPDPQIELFVLLEEKAL